MTTGDDLEGQLLLLEHRLSVLEADATGKERPTAPSVWAALIDGSGAAEEGADLGLRAADQAAAGIAGLAGGLLDLRPSFDEALTSEARHQQLDQAYKQRARAAGIDRTIAIDNAKGGPAHRLVGPTHDVTRLFEAVRCVQRGEFASAVEGVALRSVSYRRGLPDYAQVQDPAEALTLVLMHWAADFFSKMSLPLPFWSRLAEVDDADFVRRVFALYRGGANLRTLVSQFLSNLSGVAVIGLILHAYRYLDMFLLSATHELTPGNLLLSGDLRYRWMSRNANLTAFAISTGAAGLTNDPFKLNHVAFFRFCADAKSINQILDGRLEELDARADAMLQELEAHEGRA